MKKMQASYSVLMLAVAACGTSEGGDAPVMAGAPSMAAPPVQTAGDPGSTGVNAPPTMTGPQGAVADLVPSPDQMASPVDLDTPTNAVDTVPPTTGTGDGMETGDGPCTTPGLELDGIMYSPGGTLLPHPCEPFHATHNNPYAVKCIDAWADYDSGYPGDELCILPPEPSLGVQVGVHPQGLDWYAQASTGDMSGYQNVPEDFLIPLGAEAERNFRSSSPNTEEVYFYRISTRMRSGSHHLIVSGAAPSAGAVREQWVGGNVAEGLFGGVSLPGAQRVDENVPTSLEKPPEDKGLYTVLGPDRTVTYNMHYFNSTDEVLMREVWQNYWFEEDATIRVAPMFGLPLGQVAGTFAQPGNTEDIHYSWPISRDIRLIMLFGHSHVWTSNMSAWLERADGTEEVLYQSFDWFDKPTYRYDSVTMNPVPMPQQLVDGGASGVKHMKSGDKLHFNCHMQYTAERAAATDSPIQPATNGPLRFANRAYEGEMCILFGSTDSFLGTPGVDNSPVPDFAKAH